MKKPYLELVRRIRDAVRKKAQDVPVFRDGGNGAIRILAYPCCQEADDWFGGLSSFNKRLDSSTDPIEWGDDIVDYEYTFAIAAGGSRIVTGYLSPYTYDDGVNYQVDCYAYSAMKIAHCSYAQDLEAGLISGIDLGIPWLTEDNGFGPHLGALCVEVMRSDILSDFCGIYVCVSGADSEDDQKCAFAAVDVIKDFFANEGSEFELNVPELPTE